MDEYGVARAFAQLFAAVLLQMSDEIYPLHAVS
jgi:hypothetical protein